MNNTKKFTLKECNKMHYRKYKSKVEFHNKLCYQIVSHKRNNTLKEIKEKWARVLSNKTKNNTHTIATEYHNYWYRYTPQKIKVSKQDLQNAIQSAELILSEDSNIVSYSYSDSMWIYTNNTTEWMDLLEQADNRQNTLWYMSEKAEKLFEQNENICIVKKPPEYEFKVYFSGGLQDKNLATFFDNNGDNFRVGVYTLDNLRNEYSMNGNYFYAKNRKYLMLYQMTYPKTIRRIDRMVYENSETVA